MKQFFLAASCCAALSSGVAQATTYNFALTGDIASTKTFTGSNPKPYIEKQIALINAETGQATIPSFNVARGDQITGDIQLSGAVTLPSSTLFTDITINFPTIVGKGGIYGDQTFSFFLNGAQVSPFVGFDVVNGSSGSLAFSGYSQKNTSSFTFDKIVFGETVTDISAPLNGYVTIKSESTYLSYMSHPTAAVPEPESGVLLVAGLGVVGLLRARRKHPLY